MNLQFITHWAYPCLSLGLALAALGCSGGSSDFVPADAGDAASEDANNAGTSGTGGVGTGGTGGTGGIGTGGIGTGGTGGVGTGGTGGSAGEPGSGGSGASGGSGGAGGTGGAPFCGDGVIDPGEQCDGANLAGQSCSSVLGAAAIGQLACSSTCSFDTTQCCAPNCLGKQCGSDGCGSTCGSCGPSQTCQNGTCVCVPNCSGKQCGSDGCGGVCGSCPSGTSCSNGQCVCTPSCAGKACGPNGCGGSCGTCATGSSCQSGTCIKTTCDFASECGDIQTKICDPRTQQCTLAQCSSTKPCSISTDKCVYQAASGVGACYPTCKYLAGGSCGSGMQCQPQDWEPDEGLCLHTGSGGIGASCSLTQSSNGCASGSICMGDFGSSTYTCHQVCNFSSGGSCAAGQRCSHYNFCSSIGDPAAIGQTCSAGPGNSCAPQTGVWAGLCDWQKVCRKLCKKGVSGQCPTGQTCIDNVSVEGYGTCS